MERKAARLGRARARAMRALPNLCMRSQALTDTTTTAVYNARTILHFFLSVAAKTQGIHSQNRHSSYFTVWRYHNTRLRAEAAASWNSGRALALGSVILHLSFPKRIGITQKQHCWFPFGPAYRVYFKAGDLSPPLCGRDNF